jgi:RimJ/RimL family protein N-acetyltransferase
MYSPNILHKHKNLIRITDMSRDNIAEYVHLQLVLSNYMLNSKGMYCTRSNGIFVVDTPYRYTYLCGDMQFECVFPFTVVDDTTVVKTPSEDSFVILEFGRTPLDKVISDLSRKDTFARHVKKRERWLSQYICKRESDLDAAALSCIQPTNSKILNSYFLKLFSYFPMKPDVIRARKVFETQISNAVSIDEDEPPSPDVAYMKIEGSAYNKFMTSPFPLGLLSTRKIDLFRQYISPQTSMFEIGCEQRDVEFLKTLGCTVNTCSNTELTGKYDYIFCNFSPLIRTDLLTHGLSQASLSNYIILDKTNSSTEYNTRVAEHMYDGGLLFGIIPDGDRINDWITCYGEKDRFGNSLMLKDDSVVIRIGTVTNQVPIVTRENMAKSLGSDFSLVQWEPLFTPRLLAVPDVFSVFVFKKRSKNDYVGKLSTPSANQVDFQLSPLTLKDADDLLEIYNEEGTYQYMAQGTKWAREKVEKFLAFCELDELLDVTKRENYYWGVRVGRKLVGYVGVHTVKYNQQQRKKEFFVTFVIANVWRGKGLGPRALSEAMRLFHISTPQVEHLYADVHESNERSSIALQKAGFKFLLEPSGKHRLTVNVGRKTVYRMHRDLSGFSTEESRRPSGSRDAYFYTLTPSGRELMNKTLKVVMDKGDDISGHIASPMKDAGMEFEAENLTTNPRAFGRMGYVMSEIMDLCMNIPGNKYVDADAITLVLTTDEDLRQFAPDEVFQRTFPYKKYFLQDFRTMFKRLKEQSVTVTKTGDDSLWACVRDYPTDTRRVDALTDIVVEPVRIRCSEDRKESPLETWKTLLNDNEYSLVGLDDWTNDKTMAEDVRERIYALNRGCNLFNVSFCKALYCKFGWGKSKVVGCKPGLKILDCAAGWGDRLVAALAVDASMYVAWDPNPHLQDVYREIIQQTRGLRSKCDVKIFEAPMEDHEGYISNEMKGVFDIVISSPPFFVQEHYEGEETSTKRYKTEKEWIEKYFKVMLRCGISSLVDNGAFVLYLPHYLYVVAQSYLSSLNAQYEGKAAFIQNIEGTGKEGRKRYAYIWRKKAVAVTKQMDVNSPIAVLKSRLYIADDGLAKTIYDNWYQRSKVAEIIDKLNHKMYVKEKFNAIKMSVASSLRQFLNPGLGDSQITFVFLQLYSERIMTLGQKASTILSEIFENRSKL